jgi:hypothetical protein
MGIKRIIIDKHFKDADVENILRTIKDNLRQETDLQVLCPIEQDENLVVVNRVFQRFREWADELWEVASSQPGPRLSLNSVHMNLRARKMEAEARKALEYASLMKSAKLLELSHVCLTVYVAGSVRVRLHPESKAQDEEWRQAFESQVESQWISKLPNIVEKKFRPERSYGKFQIIPIKQSIIRCNVIFSLDSDGNPIRIRLGTSSGQAIIDQTAISLIKSQPPIFQSAEAIGVEFKIGVDDGLELL